ncbi:MAG: N-acetyltransferase [Acholeplasmatales bacterium]|nr:MAG: N-acetyltransferase [Acholeplasmatales bacterium]
MDKIPTIQTPRLTLRAISKQDAKAVFEYARRKEVGPSAGWNPHVTIKETETFIQYALTKQKRSQPGVWVICEKQRDRAIGSIEVHSYEGYKGEIGFVLHPDYWNRGYITEAAEAVMVYAFERMKLKRLAYAHFLDNDASARVCKKLGFTVEGVRRKGFMHEDGRILDEIVASFTYEDYYSVHKDRFAQIRTHLVFERDQG